MTGHQRTERTQGRAARAPARQSPQATQTIQTTEAPQEAQQPLATRDQILSAASRLFGEQGYAATTLRQIAQAAGIQAGSIYHHFDGKDVMAARVLDAGIDALTAAVTQHIAALPPQASTRARLEAAVRGHLWAMVHHRDLTAAHIRIYRNVSDQAREQHLPVRRAYTQLWDDLLDQAAAAGALRRDLPVPMVRQFLVGALNWPVDWFDPQRGSFEQFASQISALVFDGIAGPQEGMH